jgi:hypothetical protein
VVGPTDAKLAAFTRSRSSRCCATRSRQPRSSRSPSPHSATGLVLARTGLAHPDDLSDCGRIPPSLLLANLYGGMPRTLGFADAQAAFKAGTLDGQDGTPATFAAARLDALGMKQIVD